MKRGFRISKTIIILVVAALCAPAAWAQINPLTGDFFGSVAVDSPAGLGNIDLAFHLELDASGNMIPDSYIILDKTLVFPVVAPKVNNQDVGPRVTGHLGVSQFTLTSQLFTTTLFPGTESEKVVTHQVSLTSSTVTEGGNSIRGTYTETLTGYFSDPVNILGSFVLLRPAPVSVGFPVCQDTIAPFGELSIEEIMAGGKDALSVDYQDVSCAMCYYRHNCTGLSVSEAVMAEAIQRYRQYLSGQP